MEQCAESPENSRAQISRFQKYKKSIRYSRKIWRVLISILDEFKNQKRPLWTKNIRDPNILEPLLGPTGLLGALLGPTGLLGHWDHKLLGALLGPTGFFSQTPVLSFCWFMLLGAGLENHGTVGGGREGPDSQYCALYSWNKRQVLNTYKGSFIYEDPYSWLIIIGQ